jgi:hypothetical protein
MTLEIGNVRVDTLSARDRAALAAILTVGTAEQRQEVAGADGLAYADFAKRLREEIVCLAIPMDDLSAMDTGEFHQTIARRASEAIQARHPDLAPVVIQRSGYLFSFVNR